MKPTHITDKTKPAIIEALQVAIDAKKEYQVTISLFDDSRKGRQIALVNIWYAQIADEAYGHDVGYVEAMSKLDWGLRIATLEDPEKAEMWKGLLDGKLREDKIKRIKTYPELFPVMRKNGGMSVEYQARYLTCIQTGFAENGIILTSINDKDLLNCREANS